MVTQRHARFRFGSLHALPPASIATIVAAIGRPPPAAPADKLSGRTRPHFEDLPSLGRVYIKHYHRGGFLGRFLHRGHLWNLRSRARREFDTLEQIARIGIPAPRPIAFVDRGWLWQHTWLILAAEPNVEPLADIASRDLPRAQELLPGLAGMIGQLIGHRIHHIDLHPGNVLVGHDDRLLLIDFDKTKLSRRVPGILADLYLKRWSRAVTKHRLPRQLHLGLTHALQSTALRACVAFLLLLCCGDDTAATAIASSGHY